MKFEYSYLPTFSLLHPEAHWARIRDFHSSLFLAFFSTSPQLDKIHVFEVFFDSSPPYCFWSGFPPLPILGFIFVRQFL